MKFLFYADDGQINKTASVVVYSEMLPFTIDPYTVLKVPLYRKLQISLWMIQQNEKLL